MKKIVTTTALTTCTFFTLAMAISLALGYVFAGAGIGPYDEPRAALNLCLSLLLASLGMASLQTLWFEPASPLFKRLPYPARIGGFGLTALPVLVGCAFVGQWLPLTHPGAWIGFVVTFLVIMVAMTAGYTWYYARKAGSYDRAFRLYRERHDQASR